MPNMPLRLVGVKEGTLLAIARYQMAITKENVPRQIHAVQTRSGGVRHPPDRTRPIQAIRLILLADISNRTALPNSASWIVQYRC